MEEQQSREFASADTATGAQDAAVPERRLCAEIPVEPCCRLQHFQRPTPSHFSPNAPDATRRGDEHVVRGRRCGVRIPAANRSFTLVPPQRDNTGRIFLVSCAAIIAAAMAGFGLHWLLPAAYLAT